jgi:Secretion system C-terminal sorting domain
MKKSLYLLAAFSCAQFTQAQHIQTTLNTLGGKTTVNNIVIEWNMGDNFSLTIGNGPYITQGILQPGGFSTSSTLPVTLTGFTASRKNNNTVQLNWETVTEINNTGFAIERKLDGETGFKKIGFVATRAMGGNSSQLNRYAYIDNNSNQALSHYRLQQIDMDGRASYSPIRIVAGNATGPLIQLYPIPVVNSLVIEYSAIVQGRVQYSLTDINGKLLQEWTAPANTTRSVKDLSHLAAGTYMIVIRQDGKMVTTQKLVKN